MQVDKKRELLGKMIEADMRCLITTVFSFIFAAIIYIILLLACDVFSHRGTLVIDAVAILPSAFTYVSCIKARDRYDDWCTKNEQTIGGHGRYKGILPYIVSWILIILCFHCLCPFIVQSLS